MNRPHTHPLVLMIWTLGLLVALLAVSREPAQLIDDDSNLTEGVPPILGKDAELVSVEAISNGGRHYRLIADDPAGEIVE